MKAMILSAGLGTRLRPLTLERAKPAIPVCGKPLILRTLEHLSVQGISSFRLNLSWMPHSIMRLFGNQRAVNGEVSFSQEPQILGTGGGLKANQSFFQSDTFLMVNGDILFDFHIKQAINFHLKNRPLATLLLAPQNPPFRFTPLRMDHDLNIISFLDTPNALDQTSETFVFTGIHIIEPDIFKYIEHGVFQEIISQAYKRALKDGRRVLGYRVDGYWNDLGSPPGYLQAVQDVLSGRLGDLPTDSFIAGNSRIHPEALTRNCSLESGCILGAGSKVINSIVWEDSVIAEDSEVVNCIIGSGVNVTGIHKQEVITLNGHLSIGGH